MVALLQFNSLLLKMAIEIVDLPTKNGDVPYVMWLFTQGYRHFHLNGLV